MSSEDNSISEQGKPICEVKEENGEKPIKDLVVEDEKTICEVKEENGEKPIKDLVVEDDKPICEVNQVPKEGETPKRELKLSQEEVEKRMEAFNKLQVNATWLRNLKEFYEECEQISSLLNVKRVPPENHETPRPIPFLPCEKMIVVIKPDNSRRDFIPPKGPPRGKFDQPGKAKLVEIFDPPVVPEAHPTRTEEVESATVGIDAPVQEFIDASDTTPPVADEQICLPEEATALEANPRPNPTEEEEDDQE
ncbi:hypothetical protein RI129_011774 [Pyrocoelia pectoralis]|uniref:Uncharacterized protein n=1 Tax=Pyrocoelia pectoralis TaxID=417401 RepID=A0AAN7V0S3_9COLE